MTRAWHALATIRRRGANLTHVGSPACPAHTATSDPVAMLHTRIVRSSQPGAVASDEVR